MKRIGVLITGLICGAVLCSGSSSAAADATSTKKATAHRGRSWLRYPAVTNAPGQLAHARSLEQARHRWRAGRAYLALVYAWPDSPEAPVAQLAYAQLLETRDKLSDAFTEYQYLIEHYPNQYKHEEVLDRQFNIATNLNKKDMFETIVGNARHGAHAAESEFRVAQRDEKDGDYALAITGYQIVQSQYPASPRAYDAAFREAYCTYLICMQETPRDETGYLNARNTLSRFIQTFPDDPDNARARDYLRQVQKGLANLIFKQAYFYDKRVHPRKTQAALVAYRDFVRRFPTSELADEALSRISELEKEIHDHTSRSSR